jgi:hypothetical protein
MIQRPDPLQNAAETFQRPGLSYDEGNYAGFNPMFSGNQDAPQRAADWNWITLNFSPMQSSLQSGAAINSSGQTFQNIRVFGLALPDQPQGQILFTNAINQITSSASLFWDNANLIHRVLGALQIGTATDATAVGDVCFGSLSANRMSFIGATPALNLYSNTAFTLQATVASVGFVITGNRSMGTLSTPTRVTAASTTAFAFTGACYGNTLFNEVAAMLFTSDLSTGITDTDGAGRLSLFTTAAGTTTRTERIRIDSGGLIGINTATARRRTDILDGTNPQLRLTFTDNSVYTDFQTNSVGSLVITPTGPQVLMPSGTSSNPGMAFSAEVGMGWYRVNVGTMAFGRAGTIPFLFSPTLFRLASNVVFAWTATSGDASAASEIQLLRDATNVLALQNTTHPQTFRVYGTTTGPKYAAFQHDGTNCVIDSIGGGGIQLTNVSTGFFGATPVAKPTVTGSDGGNAAVASLLTGLASEGLVVNSSTSGTGLSGPIFTATASVSLNNSAAETSMFGTGVGSKAIAANGLTAGRTVRVKVAGYFTTGLAPQNITAKIKLGTNVIASVTFAPITSATNLGWEIEGIMTCRTTGVGGTVFGQARIIMDSTTLTSSLVDFAVATGTVAVDTTASQVVDITVTTALADAGSTYVTSNGTVELLGG